mgnify:FL=1
MRIPSKAFFVTSKIYTVRVTYLIDEIVMTIMREIK